MYPAGKPLAERLRHHGELAVVLLLFFGSNQVCVARGGGEKAVPKSSAETPAITPVAIKSPRVRRRGEFIAGSFLRLVLGVLRALYAGVPLVQ